ncbi:TRAP transporter 4TM/12TM fusion protein [Streptomonospora nanhaiensis]|uniref:TRAP transporter 4TM/12TM fusion protein n=1 Tax=Streptomonospora nanhaiensis TaxID=1323731 RepID=A0A853BL73_9ACTN|nr:TRAP transporter permease [Streptomonospora nanhaiensis]NYI95465.1 TRAP transporter 4TM/12TM fusion protein [Streptomonospora nanhaiensis]
MTTDPPSTAPPEKGADDFSDIELQKEVAELEGHNLAEETAGTRRDIRAVWRWTIFAVGLVLSLFHLYTGYFGTLPGLQQRSFHLALGLGLVFLLYPSSPQDTRRQRWYGWGLIAAGIGLIVYVQVEGIADWYVWAPGAGILALVQAARYVPWQPMGMPAADVLLALLGAGSGLFLFFAYEDIVSSVGVINPVYVAVGTVGLLLVLVAAQRTLGAALVILAGLMLAYAFFGPFLPGFLHHSGYSIDRIVSTLFLGTEGVFGTPLAISSTFIFLFLIFSAMLARTGMERFFTDLALGLTGGTTGGTAKVAVVTSAFSGTITGSSVANTVSNGAFTIPMMKRSGYHANYAGAVEAASSTGGQIAPPVMGAAAFIMIEFTGVPYLQIMQAAIVPAALFFIAQFVVVHYDAKKLGIRGVPRELLPNVRMLMATKGYLLVPIIGLFVLLSLGFSPIRSAMGAIALTVGVNLLAQLVALALRRWRGMDDRLTLWTLLDGLVDATRVALPIIIACAAAGIIAGVITLTGLGLRLSGGLVNLAENVLSPGLQLITFGLLDPTQSLLFCTLLLSMLACLILGIGVPTTANYVITATLAAPAIIAILQADLAEPTVAMLLMAHMFVYYFGVMADITPPVCLAAYAAAGISGGNPIMTGVYSVRIAVSGFVVPYMFVFSPQLLLQETGWVEGTWVFLTAVLGIVLVGVAVVGHLNTDINWVLRIVAALGGLALLHASWQGDLAGFVIGAALFAWQYWAGRGGRAQAAPAAAPAAPAAN